MKLSRLAAFVAVPAALSLVACGGGSSGVFGNNVGTGGQQANIRFVNGAPDLGGNVDIYFQATGAGAPSAPAGSNTANVAYGVTTPFIQEPPTAGTILVRAAGSSASGPVLDSLSCPLPQLSNNSKYTVAIAGVGTGNHVCLVFQDFDYSAAAQYRVHNASRNAPASLAYTTSTTSTAPGTQATYNGAQIAARGGNSATPPTTFTAVQPAGPIGNASSNPAFVIGPNTGGPTFTVLDSLNASSLFASGSLAQPDTSGSLNFPSTAGSSLFAIDCTPAAVAAMSGVQCNAGVALIGTFDTL
jgi:hypothetical protein